MAQMAQAQQLPHRAVIESRTCQSIMFKRREFCWPSSATFWGNLQIALMAPWRRATYDGTLAGLATMLSEDDAIPLQRTPPIQRTPSHGMPRASEPSEAQSNCSPCFKLEND
jgi:hypothetical protein